MAVLHNFLDIIPFTYANITINYKSIKAFTVASKKLNDKNNRTREFIISAIINNKVPDNYYVLNNWLKLKKQIYNYLEKLSNKPFIKVICINKAGRRNKYDLLITLFYDNNTTKEYMIELKFNVLKIDDAPQFVSPMKPSQYMSNNYEAYYYKNYLHKLSNMSKLKMPTAEKYFKQIHSNQPDCMKEYQIKYYNGCNASSKFTNKNEDVNFYNYSKKLSQESIEKFIKNTELDIKLITEYLHTTQKNKIYMLYSNKSFILQRVNINDYTIETVIKNAKKNRYECISKTGKKINILLRWKNGNGIAFPAFQIS
jgi:hypothetical protein